MVNERNSIETIEQDINEQADLVINQINQEVENLHDDQMTFFKEGLKKEIDTYREKELNELTLLSATSASQDKLETKRKLLTLRQKLVDELFTNVKNDLDKFVSSSDYEKYLNDKLALLPQDIKDGVFKVNEKEVDSFKSLLAKHNINCEVLPGHVLIGGFKYKDTKNGFEYDFTLDTSLKNQLEWFQNNSGFTI